MLYNHPSLNAGSNEMTYAIIALDAADITIPAGAKWTRDKMITALLAFQSADGGFGLYDSSSSGVDTTAMALQGLTNYRKRPAVQSAIERALALSLIHIFSDRSIQNRPIDSSFRHLRIS